MIISEEGMFLIPENKGINCPSKGTRCINCAYAVCCNEEHTITECLMCENEHCPHATPKTIYLD